MRKRGSSMKDYVYRMEHLVRVLRASLVRAEEAALTYAMHGDDDPDVYESMNGEIERLFNQLENAEEHLMHLDEREAA